ncbi:MAG TPA: hypothetical protein PLV53_06210 [Anaerolineaceae bacterium]|nr:hypothetical protein [Anaerolineaceae bacterium]
MHKRTARWLATLLVMAVIVGFYWLNSVATTVQAQLPTVAIPTVTGTPPGLTASVRPDIQEPFVYVRTGPNVLFPSVGLLLVDQEVPVKGISEGGMWLLIEYPGVQGSEGWVYAPYMRLSDTLVDIPVVAPPPTPTLKVTPTIDPTMAAQFVRTAVPTQLPTFTPPPPLVIPTYTTGGGFNPAGGIPMGLVILVLFLTGILVGVFSIFQGR